MTDFIGLFFMFNVPYIKQNFWKMFNVLLTYQKKYGKINLQKRKEGIKKMKRINKAAARKMYNNGQSFWITACNMPAERGILIGSLSFEKLTEIPFDTMVNSFEYYNCFSETGRYAAFYTSE